MAKGALGQSLTTTFATVTSLNTSFISGFTYSSDTLTYTGTATGIFLVNYYGEFDKNSTAVGELRILQNGTTALGTGFTFTSGVNSNRVNTSAPILTSMNTNDTLVIQAAQNSGSGFLLQTVYWTVVRIG
jgi:hypothetical protein